MALYIIQCSNNVCGLRLSLIEPIYIGQLLCHKYILCKMFKIIAFYLQVESTCMIIGNKTCLTLRFLLKLARTPLRRGVLDATLCNKLCQLPATGRWFSPGTPSSFTNKTDRHDITELLLKVVLNTKNKSKPVTISISAHKPIPMTYCTYVMFIYTYVNGAKNKVMTFLYSIAC